MGYIKLYGLISSLLLVTTYLQAQVLKPAKWSTETSSNEVKEGENLDLIFYVDIQDDWYLYSTDFDPDLGPMVTEFTFIPAPSYELVGDIKPVGAKKKYDDIWEGEYTYFTQKAEFRQTIKVLGPDLKVSGNYAYQVCTDIDGKCIPFDDEFLFDEVKVLASSEASGKTKTEAGANSTAIQSKADNAVKDGPKKKSSLSDKAAGEKNNRKQGASAKTGKEGDPSSGKKAIGSLGERDPNDPYSLLAFMVLAFLGGIGALFTPCVYPMIPMTVAFFSNQSTSRSQAIQKALFYGLSLILIYTIIGVTVSFIFGASVLNEIATSATANIIFFIIFVLFALSFFGLFEITLPSKFVNDIDKQADKGGYLGIFFMALTLGVVSFSCTAPIAGGILVEAAGGQIIKPVIGMFGFSMAFAIPFTLFAIFPEWLNSLPKSGGWLNSVKVVLGFLELAFAFKFLSVADQVYHWGLLDREVFLSIWITILSLMGFYILGKIRLPHDSELKVITVPRLILAAITFSFVVYLIPGLFGAPLKALAGYLPPMYTHDFNVAANNATVDTGYTQNNTLCEEPKYANLLHFPHGIKGYFDYDQALACAREQGKPLFIDFTGHGCVNCREMEARVWSHPEVLQRLKNNFVMLALYVDEKTELPEAEWYKSSYDDKVKKTMGKQNADFQITQFNNNAQPYYVILGPNEEILAEPVAYDLDVQNFIEFLDTALENYKNQIIASSGQK